MSDKDAPRSQGVYYALQDYAGFWRRVTAAGIDFVLVSLLVGLLVSVVGASWPAEPATQNLLFLLILFSCVTVLKGSRLSTVGHRLARVEIRTLHGERPSLLQLSLRTLVAMLGLLFVADYLWIMNDPHRQTLHDKLAGTYVIKTGAKPLGRGSIVGVALDINSFFLYFPEVRAQR